MMKKNKNIFLILLFSCSVFSISYGQNNNEWPNFRGDSGLKGISNARIKLPLDLAWTYQTDDAIIAAPIFAQNTVNHFPGSTFYG